MDLVEAFMVVGWCLIVVWGIGAAVWLIVAANEIDRR